MKLTYFPIRGLGETPRLLLVDNGVEFEDHRLADGEWEKLKPTMEFGQVPCLNDGDFQLVQTGAIMRYLAHKIGKGLHGSTDKEAARIDMIYEGVGDIRTKYATLIYRSGFTDADKKAFLDALPSELEKFEKILKSKDNGTHFFNGANMSYADYAVFEILDCLLTLCPAVLEKFPQLKAFHGRVAARPHLKAYLESDRRKGVKINGNGNQ